MRKSLPLYWIVAAIGVLSVPSAADAKVPFAGEIDTLEVHLGRGDDHLVLDSTFTLGEDAERFVLKIEGGSDTRMVFDGLEIQALYSRQLAQSLTVLAGARHDFREGSDLSYASFGIEVALTSSLAAEHYIFVSEHGVVTGAAQIVASWKLTKGLTLEPRLTLGWSGQDVPAEALAAGFADVEASVRLRKALGENFNVYTGVIHERLLGDTRGIAEASGAQSQVTRAVIGAGLSF